MRELLFILFVSTAVAATPPATQRNFVACPIVRDTQTVPCWLAEYDGELYYLGIQTDVNAEWTPPYLGHRVLVEGTIGDDMRICGGIVLRPVVTSIFPELDPACNSPILPAEDRYTVPFAPRGPGPAKGAAGRTTTPTPAPPFVVREFIIPFEFDASTMSGKESRVLQQAVLYARASHASRIEVSGFRGATLLSNGQTFTEQQGIAERRSKQIAELLVAVGVRKDSIETKWIEEPNAADGLKDFAQRRVTIVVTPQ